MSQNFCFIKIRNIEQPALISTEDAALISKASWYGVKVKYKDSVLVYAYATINGKRTAMHRLISMPSENQVVDHINRNTLDNRRENLRNCSQSQNLMNAKVRRHSSTGLKGVFPVQLKDKSSKPKWRARIQYKGVRKNLGTFGSPEEAHRAYVIAANSLCGEFART